MGQKNGKKVRTNDEYYLGAGNTDLRAGIDVYAAVRFTADAASNRVRYSDYECPTLFAVPQCHQSVGRFT